MKRIILCADDYGQNTAISQAIIELMEKNRLSATSCMTTLPDWQIHAKGLEPFKTQKDIGLHFNLTEGRPLSEAFRNTYGSELIPLSKLIIRAYLRQLDQAAIEAECLSQLNRFEAVMGRMPDFIDGHQHVHQFPVVRDVIFAVYEKYLRQAGSYVRCVKDNQAFLRIKDSAYFKGMMIQLTGAYIFKQQLIKRKIPHNSSFTGVYQFNQNLNYAAEFPSFLNQIQDQGLIMCHPGLSISTQDTIAESRHQEYLYFASDQFIQDCQAQQIILTRFHKSNDK